MDVVNGDDAAMMAMMGMSGFGSTKVHAVIERGSIRLKSFCSIQGKQVEGNQEGAVQLKKVRTWRQYMNRYAFSLITEWMF